MIKTVSFLALFFAVAYALSDAQRKEFLDAHIRGRQDVFPSAANMMLPEYSMAMEKLAKDWVKQCIYDHPNPKIHTQYKGTGQNLAISGGSPASPASATSRWMSEKADYTYKNHTCAPRRACGHYTQMVWATTTHIGCAIQRCDNLKPTWPKPVYLTACQYSPAGNFRGRQPYVSGRPCSQCPRGHRCSLKQCKKN